MKNSMSGQLISKTTLESSRMRKMQGISHLLVLAPIVYQLRTTAFSTLKPANSSLIGAMEHGGCMT